MPKTIAITPSWYWPEGIARVAGIPPFGVHELCVERLARDRPTEPAIITGDDRLDGTRLLEEVRRTGAALAALAGDSRRAVLASDTTLDGVLIVLGALAAGVHLRLVEPGSDVGAAAQAFGADLVLEDASKLDVPGAPELRDRVPDVRALREPAITITVPGGAVNHSHRSLLAGAIGMATFLDARPGRPWLTRLPLWRWDGLASVLIPLYLGAPLVLPAPGAEAFAEAIVREQVGYACHDLEAAAEITREAKKPVREARGVLDAFLLSTSGLFDPGQRQRVGRSFESPALTVFGLPETGAIFASHQSWYLDESVGIPISNAHVVPADPRNGTPIQALWEMVESAEVTVRGPALMCGYEGAEHPERFVDGRFRTGVVASSDANGMIYILPD